MKRIGNAIYLGLLLLIWAVMGNAQSVFNCTAFTTGGSGNCNYDGTGSTGGWMPGQASPYVSNGLALLVPPDQNHNAYNMNYHAAVNIQAFTTVYTFNPDGQNIAFIVQNNTNKYCCGDYGATTPPNYLFSAGAGEEGGWFQAFGSGGPAGANGNSNRIAALVLDQGSYQKYGDGTYAGSTVQLYQSLMAPMIYDDGGGYYNPTDKILTSPVQMSQPSTGTLYTPQGPRFTASQSGTTLTVTGSVTGPALVVGQEVFPYAAPNTTECVIAALGSGTGGAGTYTTDCSQTIASGAWWGSDLFSATVTYDGANLDICIVDLSLANGTCTSATSGTGTFFHQNWHNVDIPALVGANTAYIGFAGGINIQPLPGDLIHSWSYTVNSPPSLPSLNTYSTSQVSTGGNSPASNPTFSPAAGSYSGSQSVTITCTTTYSIGCYSSIPTLTSTTILPQVDSFGTDPGLYGSNGCQQGTLYSAPITVSSSTTIYAQCGSTSPGPGSNPAGFWPSNLVGALYTITGGPIQNGVLGGKATLGGKASVQ